MLGNHSWIIKISLKIMVNKSLALKLCRYYLQSQFLVQRSISIFISWFLLNWEQTVHQWNAEDNYYSITGTKQAKPDLIIAFKVKIFPYSLHSQRSAPSILSINIKASTSFWILQGFLKFRIFVCSRIKLQIMLSNPGSDSKEQLVNHKSSSTISQKHQA